MPGEMAVVEQGGLGETDLLLEALQGKEGGGGGREQRGRGGEEQRDRVKETEREREREREREGRRKGRSKTIKMYECTEFRACGEFFMTVGKQFGVRIGLSH